MKILVIGSEDEEKISRSQLKEIAGGFEDVNRVMRYRWSQLIKMVYADPLICSFCGGKMRIIAFIRDKVVIERILKHLGLSEELPHAHSPPHTGPPEPRITYEPLYDDLPLSEQVELAQTVK